MTPQATPESMPNAPSSAAVSGSVRGTMGRIMLVFGGNACAMALGLAGTVIAMRVLGPERYAVVAVALVILYIVWQFTGKGFDQSAIRLAAVTDHPRGPAAIFETVFALKAIGNAALVIVGIFLAGPLTRVFVGPSFSPIPVYLAFIGAAGASFWGFSSAAIQAESRFKRYAPVQVANNALKLAVFGLLVAGGMLTPTTVMLATAFGFFGAAIVGNRLAPAYARRSRLDRDVVPVVGRYARWLLISSVLYLLYSRLDVLMLGSLVGGEAVGLYAAAALIAQMADLLAASIMTVFLPRFSKHTEAAPLRGQVKSSLKCSVLLAVPLVPCYVLIEPVMHLLFGVQYAGSVPFLKIMYFGVLFTMVTHPLHILFYARGRPQILTALDGFILLFNLVGHYFAITRYGPAGAAVVVLASRILAGLLLSLGVTAELSTRSRSTVE